MRRKLYSKLYHLLAVLRQLIILKIFNEKNYAPSVMLNIPYLNKKQLRNFFQISGSSQSLTATILILLTDKKICYHSKSQRKAKMPINRLITQLEINSDFSVVFHHIRTFCAYSYYFILFLLHILHNYLQWKINF